VIHPCFKPHPCGYFGDPKRECRCSPAQVERYRNRISGPLLDRIDIHVEVPAVAFRELAGKDQPGEPSAAIRERIAVVREVQRERFGASSKVRCNTRMTSKQIKAQCALGEAAEGMLQMAMTELNFSARAYDRILKVGRTIADLEGSATIEAPPCRGGDPVSHPGPQSLGVKLQF